MVDELRMVAIFRADLDLPPGKLAVQAGHAFLTAWRNAYASDEDSALDYANDMQTKIVLLAPDLATLERIEAKAKKRGVHTALITDAARTVLLEPTVTVLGLGPMSKTDCNALTRGLEML
jgi:peptidyl-tRNA hydrolase